MSELRAGEMQLRIWQLEDEVEDLRRQVLGHPRRRKSHLPPKPGAAVQAIDVLKVATKTMTMAEIQVLLPDVKQMTLYMGLRDLRLAHPPKVETFGTGSTHEPFRYALIGRFDREEKLIEPA